MMKRAMSDRGQLLYLVFAFGAGCLTCHMIERDVSTEARVSPPAAITSALEERGPPTKQELGQSSWTLLHTMAANFPDEPTARQRARVDNFLRGLGELYPCAVCAAHFRGYLAEHPATTGSRQELSLWLCAAHNEVRAAGRSARVRVMLGVRVRLADPNSLLFRMLTPWRPHYR